MVSCAVRSCCRRHGVDKKKTSGIIFYSSDRFLVVFFFNFLDKCKECVHVEINECMWIMDYFVVPLHKHPEHLKSSCDLINSEWKRSDTARLRSLEASSDQLPTSLILLKENIVVGYLKLSPIPSIHDGCFVETVVIDKKERGKGYGTVLMRQAEEYCRNNLTYLNVIYLSTKGQEGFYSKLGYTECKPISIYGSFTPSPLNNTNITSTKTNTPKVYVAKNVPVAPPMPVKSLDILTIIKTYMKKDL